MCLVLLQDLTDAISACLANNSFMQLFEDGDGHAYALRTVCECFLSMYRPEHIEDAFDGMLSDVTQAIVQLKDLLSGLLVLLHPIPGYMGTSNANVSVLVDQSDSKSTKSAKASSKGGKEGAESSKFHSAVVLAIASNPTWQKRLDECLVKGAVSMKLGPELQQLCEDLSNEYDSDAATSVTDTLRKAIKQFGDLKKALRTGATDELQSLLIDRLRKVAAYTVKQDDVSNMPSDHVHVIITGCKHFAAGHPGIMELQQEIRSWSGKMAKVLGRQKLVGLPDALRAQGESCVVPWPELSELLNNLSEEFTDSESAAMINLLTDFLFPDLYQQARRQGKGNNIIC